MAIGAGLWLAPRLTLKALGLKETEGEGLAITRIAATRDLVLGAWMVSLADDPVAMRRAAVGIAACDAGDTLTFALLGTKGGDSLAGAARGVVAAGSATALGIWLADRLGS